VALGLVKQGLPNYPKGRRRNLTFLELEARRLDTLIGQLLALPRIDKWSGLEAVRRPFDPDDVVQKSRTMGRFEGARAESQRGDQNYADAGRSPDSRGSYYEAPSGGKTTNPNVVRKRSAFTLDGTLSRFQTSSQQFFAGRFLGRIGTGNSPGPHGVPRDILAVPAGSRTMAFRKRRAGLAPLPKRAVNVHSGVIRADE